MRTFMRLKNRRVGKLPSHFRDTDLRYADELVATFLRRYTHPGDTVLDPFAGFGTTLLVAEAMDRIAYGVEYDAQRAQYIRSQVRHPQHLIHGDARAILRYALPPFDFSITSPPFMERTDAEDPFANYAAPGRGYAAYLHDLQQVYTSLRHLMKPQARVVLEVANLRGPDGITTLAWDVARTLSTVLHFEGEVVIGWDSYNYGYDHSYCLIFRQHL